MVAGRQLRVRRAARAAAPRVPRESRRSDGRHGVLRGHGRRARAAARDGRDRPHRLTGSRSRRARGSRHRRNDVDTSRRPWTTRTRACSRTGRARTATSSDARRIRGRGRRSSGDAAKRRSTRPRGGARRRGRGDVPTGAAVRSPQRWGGARPRARARASGERAAVSHSGRACHAMSLGGSDDL